MYGYNQNVAGAHDFGGPGFGGPGVGGMHHGFAGPDYCYYDHGGFGHGFRGGFALIVVLFILLIIIGATVVNYD
ncbi:YjcZ family sporulation protein [Salinibacillus aidingensis]